MISGAHSVSTNGSEWLAGVVSAAIVPLKTLQGSASRHDALEQVMAGVREAAPALAWLRRLAPGPTNCIG